MGLRALRAKHYRRDRRLARARSPDLPALLCASKRNSSDTGTFNAVAIASMISKDGAFTPRSTKPKNVTEMPICSANRS
jgi:hypothetical protein